MSQEFYGIVYIGTCSVNGKQYVGQTIAKDPIAYCRGHLLNAKKGEDKLFYNAIRKHGAENFTFEIIWRAVDKASLDVSEDSFIKLFETMSPNGYNLRGGGAHGRWPEEIKTKFSVSATAAHARPEVKIKHRQAMIPILNRPDLKKILSEALGKSRWINNGMLNGRLKLDAPLPIGWSFGMTTKSRNRLKEIATGTIWINNGDDNRRILVDEVLPSGWSHGKLPWYHKRDLKGA